MTKAKWQRQYSILGKSVFSEQDLALLVHIQQKWYANVVGFFSDMSGIPLSNPAAEKHIVDGMMASKSIAHHIGQLLHQHGTHATNDEIDTLFHLLDQMKDNLDYCSSLKKSNKAFGTTVEAVEAANGISLEKAVQVHRQIMDKLANMNATGGYMSKFKKVAPGAHGWISGGLLGLSKNMFGPLHTLGAHAAEAITGIKKDQQDRAEALKNAQIYQGTSGFSGSSASGSNRSQSDYSFSGAGTSTFGRKSSAVASDGLFTFFDKDAYKARWTNEVVNLLRKIAGIKPSSGSSMLSGLLEGAAGGFAAEAAAGAGAIGGGGAAAVATGLSLGEMAAAGVGILAVGKLGMMGVDRLVKQHKGADIIGSAGLMGLPISGAEGIGETLGASWVPDSKSKFLKNSLAPDVPVDTVPIASTGGSVFDMNAMSKELTKLFEDFVKKLTPQSSGSSRSGRDDVHDGRDSLLNSVNKGSLYINR